MATAANVQREAAALISSITILANTLVSTINTPTGTTLTDEQLYALYNARERLQGAVENTQAAFNL